MSYDLNRTCNLKRKINETQRHLKTESKLGCPSGGRCGEGKGKAQTSRHKIRYRGVGHSTGNAVGGSVINEHGGRWPPGFPRGTHRKVWERWIAMCHA